MAWAREQFATPVEDAIPPTLEYLWRWYGMLVDCREYGFEIIGVLTHQEIGAWAKLLKINISPVEVLILRRLDRAFVSVHSGKKGEERSSFPLTTELFDKSFSK